MTRPRSILLVAIAPMFIVSFAAHAQHDRERAAGQEAPTGSALVRTLREEPRGPRAKDAHALRDSSLFAVPPPKPREFQRHDLVQIIVRETSKTRSSQTLDAEKEYGLKGGVTKFPSFDLKQLLDLTIGQGSGENVPEVDMSLNKDFKGEGEYERRDDFTARLTAEVIDILPNGSLVLEARTHIRTDDEVSAMTVTGVCRAEDVTSANTVLSNQLHDLSIEKKNTGELKNVGEKGLIAKVLDALFAF